MDDRQFDREIQEKMKNYQGEAFDANHLESLHQRLDAVVATPWYIRYRSELLFILCILLLMLFYFFLYPFFYKNSYLIESQYINSGLQTLQEQQDKLLEENKKLLNQLEQQRQQTSQLKAELYNTKKELVISEKNTAYLQNALWVYAQEKRGSSFSLRKGEGAWVHQALLPKVPPGVATSNDWFESGLLSFDPVLQEGETPPKKNASGMLSGKTRLKLKQHYWRGVGIQLGVVGGLSKIKSDLGEGDFNPEMGLLGEFRFTPSWSLEAGVKYNLWTHEIEDKFLLEQLNLPNFKSGLGALEATEVESFLLEFPLNLRYRHPVANRFSLVGSMGISPVYYITQKFEYDYKVDFQLDSVNYAQLTVNDKSPRQKLGKLYSGTLNLAIGGNKVFSDRSQFEVMLSYQIGLREMGIERMKPNLLALRARYWWKVK
ncbi:hypothetical protein AAG747_04405 [Rapidithrix thailandica]|uniref:Outer membrane protein beta-barrel domain-containing protein n=1 Tax=Rapidithrix thailandica TaxID=413964 RepID=A0AAW9RVQ1_9BACT